MIDSMTLIILLSMACVTYLTRIAGYLIVRNITLSSRALKILEAAPGCVLISIIAPRFATTNLADLIALVVTIFAAMRLSLLPTVIIAIISAGSLRYFLNMG